MPSSDPDPSLSTDGHVTRRDILRHAIVGGSVAALMPLHGASLAAPRAGMQAAAQGALPGGSLDPTRIRKYRTRLPVPRAMPLTGTSDRGAVDYYAIAARQFTQQMLPVGHPTTTVWGYGSATAPGTFHTPGCTIEAQAGRPVRIRWVNGLLDHRGKYRSHLFPVDPALHWANPPGGAAGRDSMPEFTTTPGPYTGPVPTVAHLHGAHTEQQYDGYPEAWYLPAADDIPAGYATAGSFHDMFAAEAEAALGVDRSPGSAVYQYANDQRAAALWYHDHALGLTRLNVYAGLAGLYILRGGSCDLPPEALPGPGPRRGDPPRTRYYEIPLVVQDRSFNTDGSLFFPGSRAFAGDVPATASFAPDTDVPPIWNPVNFGNTILVNGVTWPVLPVEPRRYRFRLLNACNDRTLIFKIVSDPLAPRPVAPQLPLWQIGSDGGFLPHPEQLDQVLVAPSERADVVVDFTGLPVGTTLHLINEGPDGQFGGMMPRPYSDPETTGQVMKFVVRPLASGDRSTPPGELTLPALPALGSATETWRVALTRKNSRFYPSSLVKVVLGTFDGEGRIVHQHWSAPATETPALGATGIWEFVNSTAHAHPLHLHQVQFQVLNREPTGGAQGTVRPPDAGENGFKDTVICYPGEITRVKARFDLPGRFVYHCHMLSHEDNEMMRPIVVQGLPEAR
jgi:bilirubin oxidase